MRSNNLQFENLKAKLSSVRRSAWKPIVREGDGDLTASKFSGKPWLSAGETWPICPNCQKPMQLFLQLNLDQLPKSLKEKFGNGILQMFYCTSTEPYCEGDCDAGESAKIKLLRIVQPEAKSAKIEIPEIENLFPAKLIIRWEEIGDSPSWEDVESFFGITPNEENLDILDNYFGWRPEPGDKLAGWPDWIQGSSYPNCPTCNQTMTQFIFQLDSEDNITYMWGDAGRGYLVQCPEHKEKLAFFWQCH
ncbi:DUF1963 domain-containing protein [Planktothrix sp. FACHB-1355]|uniref:DUF1963 domain-containing protein n=1 Tax=Aerosakkonema funiforme FACHB-1375 TaxID=2949571 RepID=A0A926VKN8_9CYAN|nr:MULTISPECIES: DUF1963 domain-containing protein [Oscillatoriales]MBD2184184.1 DUF1963 domain-containing protein [Aerosakkonema funiforme FACHB-1375]MBD3558228.1 DUF1963 domain-containing protein [Planktothrix sp. FACHB-1355]